MGSAPSLGREPPGSGDPRTLFLTAFTIDFLRFEVHLSCSVGDLRRDSISAHGWYGSRSNLVYMDFFQAINEPPLKYFLIFKNKKGKRFLFLPGSGPPDFSPQLVFVWVQIPKIIRKSCPNYHQRYAIDNIVNCVCVCVCVCYLIHLFL